LSEPFTIVLQLWLVWWLVVVLLCFTA